MLKEAAIMIRKLADENKELREQIEINTQTSELISTLVKKGGMSAQDVLDKKAEFGNASLEDLRITKKALELSPRLSKLGSLSDTGIEPMTAEEKFYKAILED